MFTKSYVCMILIVISFLTACAPQAAATPSISNDPFTLRLAVADAEDRPSDPYVREFIEQVKTRSNGNITIEPIWDAGAETTPAFEQGVIKALKEGQYDLGLAGSRAFDLEGITSFQALQAPFLITNDALAEAVASSDIATRMLENASSAGLVGLTLWPEDLRHPFSVVPGEQILSPEDFAGLSVRATPSELTYQMLEAFGASPMMGDTDYQAAESGLRQGFSLTGTPTATGNVVFFPKFQVLFANGAAFEKFSQAQQNILKEAAIATQKRAIAEHPSEVDAAIAWCADGGTVVMASEEQVAAFEAAAQPVFASLEKNSLNAELIAAIRELKANTEASPGAEACAPETGSANPGTDAEAQAWSQGLPPNGVWQVQLTTEDFIRMGVSGAAAADWIGVYTFQYQDGRVIEDFKGPARTTHCEADLEVIGDVVRQTYTISDPPRVCIDPVIVSEFQWRVDEAGLHLHLVSIEEAPFQENAAVLEAKPWQKVEEWSTGLPPNGRWTVNLTVEDFVSKGILKSKAAEWAGIYTWTFQNGKAKQEYQGRGSYSCQADLALVGNVVKFTYTSGVDCKNEVDDVQWRLDEEGLHLHLVAIRNAPFAENKAMYEAKPWQKVEEWSTGLPPNGVWRVELTADDFVRMGVAQSKANQIAGTYTWTLQDGNYIMLWEGGAGQSGKCVGTYAVVDDFVRMTSTTDDCPGEVWDLEWLLADDGLHVHLLATKNIPFVETKANFEAKPWQKVE